MLCSPEQIEAKRKKALEKLQAKLNNSNNNTRKISGTKPSHSKAVSSPTTTFQSKESQNRNVNPTMFYKSTSSPKPLPSSTVSSPTTSFQKNNYQNRTMVTKVLFNRNNSNESKFSPYVKNKQKESNFLKLLSGPILGSTHFISDRRFVVKMEKYSEVVNNLCKKMPTKRYDPSTKLWSFDINDYDPLMNQLTLLRPDIVIDKIPTCVVNLIKENAKQQNAIKSVDLSSIDEELLNSLMKFQFDGVQFGIQKRGRCLIADEMGLGKTFQALAIASYFRKDWPMLIVTTSSTRNSWQQTIQTYLPSVPLYYVTHMASGKDFIKDSKILILSHDLMARTVDKLLTMEFRTLIIDESHTIKNFKTKCTKAAYRLAKQAKRVILLSGTPALSRPSELFTQIQLIDDTFFKDFKEYSLRYCNGHDSQFGWDASGQSNLQELEIVLNLKFMIRRTKDQVLPLLPRKTRELIMLNQDLINHSATDAEKKCFSTLRDDFNQTKTKNSYDKTLLLTYFNQTAKMKQQAVCTYLINELKKDANLHKKLLIFAHHQIMLDSVCEVLDANDIPYVRIDGRTTSERRAFFVNKFNTVDKYRCAVLSITATNAGITLTAASLVIFSELHWNPSILVQAEGRAHRIGQENTVEVRYLLAKNSADDDMWNIIKSKVDVLNEAGLSKDSFDDAVLKSQELCETNMNKSQNNKTIEDFFPKQPTPKDFTNIESMSFDNIDSELIDFINDEDDDILANVQI